MTATAWAPHELPVPENPVAPLLAWLDGLLLGALSRPSAELPVMAGVGGVGAPDSVGDLGPALGALARGFALDALDVALLGLALAPELHDSYGRAIAAVQGTGHGVRPSSGLAAELLGAGPAEQLQIRARLSPAGDLARESLLHPLADGIHPDATVTRIVLGVAGLDPGLMGVACLEAGSPARLGPRPTRLLARAADLSREHSVVLNLVGPAGAFLDAAGDAAARTGRALLVVDARSLTGRDDCEVAARHIGREGRLRGAVVAVHDLAPDGGSAGGLDLLRALVPRHGLLLLGSAAPWPEPDTRALAPAAVTTVCLGEPDASARARLWDALLGAEAEGRLLGERYQLYGHEIVAAVSAAEATMALDDGPTLAERAAAFAAAGRTGRLESVATRVVPARKWDDLVVPAAVRVRLAEALCGRVEHAAQVWEGWGYADSMPTGRGTSALFCGPSGTGKTLAAEVVAGRLGLEMYTIDLATVVSKFIGETEKNLAQVFDAAAASNAILFFDEADALFGKRGEVREAHDRYANLEVSFLLQRFEEYQGVTILATNLLANLDDAFARRFTYTIAFPRPEVAERERLWRVLLPATLPLADDVNLAALASRFPLAGGSIRNAALGAAFLAAADGEAMVAERHLLAALGREHQKLGAPMPGGNPDLAFWEPTTERGR